jgi:hypothetical protein
MTVLYKSSYRHRYIIIVVKYNNSLLNAVNNYMIFTGKHEA